MKNLLLFILLLVNIPIFSQNRNYINEDGLPQYYLTIDTVIYFELTNNCPFSTKCFFLDSIKNVSTIDTIEDNLYRIKYSLSKKNDLVNLLKSDENIKYLSYEYLNKDTIIHWTTNKIVLKIKSEVAID